jgi:thymidylate synthase
MDSGSIVVGNDSVRTAHVDEAFVDTLEAVLDRGHHFGPDRAEKSRKGSTEILGFQVLMADARDRITTNPKRPLNVVGAVARFAWMVAGSDRLEDIAFYEPKVRPYTDNMISVPGSNYGMRLFQPRPGLNQLRGVVDRILGEPDSRRAAAVIWTPDDAVRRSNDVPCAFGAFYHVRDGHLVTTTVMRSNNAFLLLPYNAFEFSLIGEMVAAAVGAEMGPYVHYAASMHVLDQESDAAREVIGEYSRTTPKRRPMPPMPTTPDPLRQAETIARLEAGLRNDPARLNSKPISDLRKQAESELHPYWLAFYDVLLCHMLVRADRATEALELARQLPEYFSWSVEYLINKALNDRRPGGQLTLVPPASDFIADIAGAMSDIDVGQFERLDGVITGLEREGVIAPVSRIEAVHL